VFFTALGKIRKKVLTVFLVPVFCLPCGREGVGFPLQNGTVMGWLCCGRNCSTEEEEEEKEEEEKEERKKSSYKLKRRCTRNEIKRKQHLVRKERRKSVI
jgi:hypothetical protein